MRRLIAALERRWYQPGPVGLLIGGLVPLAILHGLLVRLRRHAYRRGWLASQRVAVPVLVIGNISVGGSGKTPLTMAVVARLQARGRRPAVISRGYGGRAPAYPLAVRADTPVEESGDEPLLLARRTGVPVVVDPDRCRAASLAIERYQADVLIADDGLQHYRLQRDAEIAVRDGARGYGNGWLLPAGPLREPLSRLANIDLECVQGVDDDFWLVPADARELISEHSRALEAFSGQTVHAIAGIGHPARFFDMLRGAGLTVLEHPMPDHHVYTAAELSFDDACPVLMTEKDAVKCQTIAGAGVWYVPVETCLAPAAAERLDQLLDVLCGTPVSNKKSVESS
ncbi:MAG: tetraacyldisaccharide 4'-kinase [Salinisphaera sp.]|jgi:tetraacyldisaccharide 4'-kinase|nr:tetraacyldisaccharide 4'-kinase [Salinisphaera sp.]